MRVLPREDVGRQNRHGKNLTDAGKYYPEHKSLDGYQEKK